MADDEVDGGVHEALAANMRAAAVMAMQVGERVARTWADLARDAQQQASADARLLAARIDAERAAAVARLAVVDQAGWWKQASVADVAGVVETAAAWRDVDPAAKRAALAIEREIGGRYGLDPAVLRQHARAGQDRADALTAVTAADVLDRALTDRETRAQQDAGEEGRAHDRAVAAGTGQVVAAGHASAADSEREAGSVAYDSAERREDLAAALRGTADPDLVAGRVRADINFAHPATKTTALEATSSSSPRGPCHTLDRPRQRPPRTR